MFGIVHLKKLKIPVKSDKNYFVIIRIRCKINSINSSNSCKISKSETQVISEIRVL